MKYVFAGDRDISLWVLQDLINAGYIPQALMVVDEMKQSHANELIRISGLKKENVFFGKEFSDPSGIAFLMNINPDYIIGIHFPYIISKEVLDIPRIGFVNLHPAYLPYNRGWHTPSWAILNNSPIGATLHFMSEQVDMGDVIARKELQINSNETANTLYKRLKILERELFKENIKALAEYKIQKQHQSPKEGDSHSKRQLYDLPIRRLDLNKSYYGKELLQLLRAFSTNNIKESMYFFNEEKINYLRLEIGQYPLRENPEFIKRINNINESYQRYVDSGKLFGFAKMLFELNEELLLFLKENMMSTDVSDPDIFQLLEHILGWRIQFNFENKNIKDEDEFSWSRWSHIPSFPSKLSTRQV